MLPETVIHHPSKAYKLHSDPSRLDPLHADSQISFLPYLNEKQDTNSIISLARQLSSHPNISEFNTDEARAALRDLGMVAASLKRNGIEPAIVAPELQRSLIICGNRAGTVPRDTVYSYGPWNPEGERMRRFTILPQEEIFIKSFKGGMSELDTTVDEVDSATTLDLNDPEFARFMKSATNHFGLMVNAIVQVRKQVSPEIFTGQLRPFFEPFRVDEKIYLAPGGAQMPILLLDQLFWGSDYESESYQRYFDENIIYTPMETREKSAEFARRLSLVTKLRQYMNSMVTMEHQSKVSLVSVLEFLNKLIAFRRPHLLIAQENFRLRSGSDVGSGGYRPDILELLIAKTEESRNLVKGVLGG